MRRLLFLAAAGLALVALAGAVGLPDLAGAQESPEADHDTITVSGVGVVAAIPNEAQMSFAVETRGQTARAAVSANADAARRVINALRQAGRELATQYVSVYPVTGENSQIQGYSATNSVSAVSDVDDAPALIDAAVEAGANQVSGPAMSSSNAEELYRQALSKAVAEARERAEVLARAANRSLGEITSITETAAASPLPYAERAAALDAATPIVPGKQDTNATVSVTFVLR